MRIIDLTDEYKPLFAQCLEDWSAEAQEAGPRRACWIEHMIPRGLRAKLALDENGTVAGMIQYLPVELSTVDGEGLYFIPCIWVHGHKQGRGNLQGRGMGSALLDAAEADARTLGAKGMAAWGLWLPVWMKASWYRKHGYRHADRQGIASLVWKPFTPDAKPPRWFPQPDRPPERIPGKVAVTAYVNGWCMGQNLVIERAKRAAAEFGEAVAYQEVSTVDRKTIAACGHSDALFIDGRMVRSGPPPTYEKIHALIAKRVAAL